MQKKWGAGRKHHTGQQKRKTLTSTELVAAVQDFLFVFSWICSGSQRFGHIPINYWCGSKLLTGTVFILTVTQGTLSQLRYSLSLMLEI